MQKVSKRTARLVGCVLAAAALSACAAVGSAALAGDADTVIQACKHTVTGRLRAVSSAGACRSSEAPISWNAQGPAGPQGPPGPKGDPGPGMTKLNDIDGLDCTRDDGTNGTIDLEIANDGDVTLLCVTGTNPPPPPPPPPPPGRCGARHQRGRLRPGRHGRRRLRGDQERRERGRRPVGDRARLRRRL